MIPSLNGVVREVQGLDGAFTFSERIAQRIWQRGEFDLDAAVTTDGRSLRVLDPGRWNRLGGPDFRRARLLLGSQSVSGDVEVHLHDRDWEAHGHARDSHYDSVVLHVVLFPPLPGSRGQIVEGRQLPVLVLLPLLNRGLEEYAEEAAMEEMAGRSGDLRLEELASMDPSARAEQFCWWARRRWREKVQHAERRIDRLGWAEACHHAALEILGYRFNRIPMLRIAGRAPLSVWIAGGGPAEALYTREFDRWARQGVRPANHPRRRLQQYARWVATRPDWPERLRAIVGQREMQPSSDPTLPPPKDRRRARSAWRRGFAMEICGMAVTGSRWDNLVTDGFLPLLAAGGAAGAFALWREWPAGDIPGILQAARHLIRSDPGGMTANQEAVQGMLGWMLAREMGDRDSATQSAEGQRLPCC